MERLTKEQAAVIGVFTGILCGSFSDMQEYASKLAGESLWTHEFASRELSDKLKELAKPDFLAICAL
jgi:hypothetical protein